MPMARLAARNILAITTTVQCVAGVVEFAVQAHQGPSCCRSYPNVDDVIGPGAHLWLRRGDRCARRDQIPIRTLRNISLNPNFGGEVMVVSLGCEKLQPERLLPPGSFAIVDERNPTPDPSSTSCACKTMPTSASMSMIDSVMKTADDAPRNA